MEPPRSFFFHYNKPATLKAGKPQVSVHYRNQCHVVDNVVCSVPTQGKINRAQPRFVMTGRASELEIVDGVAYLK